MEVKEVKPNTIQAIKSMHKGRRLQEQLEIERQNQKIAHQILNARPNIKANALEKDFQSHMKAHDLLVKIKKTKFKTPPKKKPQSVPPGPPPIPKPRISTINKLEGYIIVPKQKKKRVKRKVTESV